LLIGAGRGGSKGGAGGDVPSRSPKILDLPLGAEIAEWLASLGRVQEVVVFNPSITKSDGQ